MTATMLSATDTLKRIVEACLQIPLSNSEYESAELQAKRKLARIIEREGDSDGERLSPLYLAQLIIEAVKAERFIAFCDNVRKEIKKEMPAAEAAGQI